MVGVTEERTGDGGNGIDVQFDVRSPTTRSQCCGVLSAEADDRDVDEIGQKAAVLATADYVVRIFLRDDEGIARQRLRDLLNRIAEYRYRERPGRSFPRRSFKPSPKWGPNGRRGG